MGIINDFLSILSGVGKRDSLEKFIQKGFLGALAIGVIILFSFVSIISLIVYLII